MTGTEIKNYILESGIKLWQVAEKYGVTDSNFSRRLRKPFSEKEFAKVKKIVDELKATT